LKERRLFANLTIALLIVGIFTALPLVKGQVFVSVGDIEAILLSPDLRANQVYPPGQTFTDFVNGMVAFDQDIIDVEQLAHPNGKWYGRGVTVAVLDTGLLPIWNYFFPRNRIITQLGIGFVQDLDTGEITTVPWDDAVNGHGTHVASTIIGYNYRGVPVTGVAPLAKIIPVKVLSFYDYASQTAWGTSGMVAAGIDYVTSLVTSGMLEPGKIIINMSLGSSSLVTDIEDAINRAIKAGVIVVASAGNRGTAGMGWPGAYPQAISAAWAGWTGQWWPIVNNRENRFFWQNDVPEDLMTPAPASLYYGEWAGTQAYMSSSSSRALPGQDLDVAAPGALVVGPYWTPAWGPLPSDPSLAYAYVSGTSMSSPHVAGAAALLAEKKAVKLTQSQMEAVLENTAILPPLTYANTAGFPSATLRYMSVYVGIGPVGYYWTQWNDNAVGNGLLQVDAAVAAVGG